MLLSIMALQCLSTALVFEARSESIRGQAAVAQVILNRVHDLRYPNDVCGVVNQRHQFSFMHDGKPELLDRPLAWRRARAVAKLVASGTLDAGIGNADHYYALWAPTPYWAADMVATVTIGQHTFFER
jgi:spore germination cell wall hydrolase CwlJ-like protein